MLIVLACSIAAYLWFVAPEQKAWADAQAAKTVAALQTYIAAYPNGRHAKDAHAQIETLRADEAVFERAVHIGTRESYSEFLRQYPGHRREAEAQAVLASNDVDPKDIVVLLSEGKVEVEAHGADIQRVRVRIRRQTAYPLRVQIPAGTLFVPKRNAAQTMIATETRALQLANTDWQDIDIAVACANWSKDVPGSTDAMRVRSSSNANLMLIAPMLSKATSISTRQAIVWIVSDNTKYSGLGKLVSGCFISFGCKGTRVIGPPEAAEAMRMISSAGLDIRRFAIWNDRVAILRGLPAGDLKDWLDGQVRASKNISPPRNITAETGHGSRVQTATVVRQAQPITRSLAPFSAPVAPTQRAYQVGEPATRAESAGSAPCSIGDGYQTVRFSNGAVYSGSFMGCRPLPGPAQFQQGVTILNGFAEPIDDHTVRLRTDNAEAIITLQISRVVR